MRAQQCVTAVYEELEAARAGVAELEAAGFSDEQVSLVTRSVHGQMAHEEELEHGDRGEKNAIRGASMGGLIGLLLGAPVLAIPGIGPLLLAGPIAAGLTGAVLGGFLGGMSGWGVPRDQIARYEAKVKEGKVLVVVYGEPDRVAAAQALLENAPGEKHVQMHASSADETDASERLKR